MKRDFLIVFSMFLTLTVGYFMNTPSIELDTHNVRTVTVKAGILFGALLPNMPMII